MSEFQPPPSTAGDKSDWAEAVSVRGSLEVSSEPDLPVVPLARDAVEGRAGPTCSPPFTTSETMVGTEEEEKESPLKKNKTLQLKKKSKESNNC